MGAGGAREKSRRSLVRMNAPGRAGERPGDHPGHAVRSLQDRRALSRTTRRVARAGRLRRGRLSERRCPPTCRRSGSPLARCASPSSCDDRPCPRRACCPALPAPMRSLNGPRTSSGKPSGYVGKGRAVTRPMCSQWPTVVSLPAESVASRPVQGQRLGHRRHSQDRDDGPRGRVSAGRAAGGRPRG